MTQYALTIMTSEATPLADDLPQRIAGLCDDRGAAVLSSRWLTPRLAFEAIVPQKPALNFAETLADLPADIALQPTANRRKSLLIADMDCTIITTESLNELASLSGHGDAVAAITARTMQGEIDFAQSLLERLAIIKGSDAKLLQTIIDDVELNDGAAALVASMKAQGARTILASGGFTFLTEVIAKKLGFDEHYANQMIIKDGLITGEVVMPILDQNAKRVRLDKTTAAMGITRADAVTVGDGANDRGMIEASGLGIAYRAKDALKAVANAQLDHADLRGVLWLQGYSGGEIIT